MAKSPRIHSGWVHEQSYMLKAQLFVNSPKGSTSMPTRYDCPILQNKEKGKWSHLKKPYQLIQADPKLLDDSGEVPKLTWVVGGLIPICEIVSLLDEKLAMWSSISCVSKKPKKKKTQNNSNINNGTTCLFREVAII